MKINEAYQNLLKRPEKALLFIIKYYILLSTIIIILAILFNYIDSSTYKASFCFSTSCIARFLSYFQTIGPLFEFLLKTLLSIVTIFGVFAALKNYLNMTNTSRLSVHLTHLNTFKEYVQIEINNEPRIDKKSVDILKWYNLAFPNSRRGSLMVGCDYLLTINNINREISSSNSSSKGTTIKVFKYNEHQSRIIEKLSLLGIYVSRMPKKDFFEVEEELFDLVNKVNKELCLLGSEHRLLKREYA